MNDMIKYINISATAAVLGVSQATVRNWIRHKYLNPVKGEKPTCFVHSEVLELKDKLNKGEISRLSQRANKRVANRRFIPCEYLTDKSNSIFIKDIINYIKINNLAIYPSLFFLTINFLINKKLINNSDIQKILLFDSVNYNKRNIYSELKSWYFEIKDNLLVSSYQGLVKLKLPDENDVLGIVYQSILLEGDKAKKGSYYTPQKIVEKIIDEYLEEDSKFLDPCCGTGQFLLAAANKISNPDKIYGVDIDYIAVRIARVNLIAKFPEYDFEPCIYNKNFLTDLNLKEMFKGDFDLITTNPPWGLHYKTNELKMLKKLFPEIKSGESFSYILNKSIQLLKPSGILSFILPESILNVSLHKDIRKIILNDTVIYKIEDLVRVFKNVFTPVIRVDLCKGKVNKKSSESHKVLVRDKQKEFYVNQLNFQNNKNYIFNIQASEFDNQILDKVYSYKHITLKKNASWILGIVTGDNNRYLRDKQLPGYEEIIRGSDVSKFNIQKVNRFIKFEPQKFQQVVPEEKFRTKEKLIYKFISRKLIFAYDNKQRLTLNSANAIIPQIENYPLKVILALFNSTLYQFIFQKKFASIKVLKSHLEQLPLPILDKDVFACIIEKVDLLLSGEGNIDSIDEIVFNFYGFDQKTRKYIQNTAY